MKFRIYSAVQSFGGGERYLSLLVPALRERGHSVELILHRTASPPQLRKLVESRASNQRDPAVILFNGIGSLYRWGARDIGAPVSLYVHHSSIDDDQGSYAKRVVRPWLLRGLSLRLQAIIRVCNSALPGKIGKCPVYTVYNGVYPRNVGTLRREPHDDFVIGMLGTLNENKNQRAGIRILSELPNGFRLKVIGTGPLANDLRECADCSGVTGRVQFVGFVEDPLSEIGSCHAALLLSRNEAMPFSALEAMSVGVPVISYRVGGIPELIEHRGNGMITEHGDERSAGRFLLELSENEDFRHTLGIRAHATVSTRFNVSNMVDGLLEAVSRALTERQSGY